MNIKKKYILAYIKNNFYALLIINGVFFFCFSIPCLLDSHVWVVAMAFLIVCFTISLIVFLISLLYIVRFKKTIKLQEEMYNITFNNKNEIVLKKNYNYLSDEWFIQAGSLALYYKYIKTMRLKTHHGKNNSHSIVFKTQDGKKYTVGIEKTTHYTKVRKWLNNLKEINNNEKE